VKTARTSSARQMNRTRRPPKNGPRVPSLRHHKASGQGYVVLNGKPIYLGRHGDPATAQKYHQVIAEWLAAGRQMPIDPEQITVKELLARFWRYARAYYVRADGRPTSELASLRAAFRPLRELYAETKACDFGPRALKAVREEMVRLGWCRGTINKAVGRIRSAFRWATEQELDAGPPESRVHDLPAQSAEAFLVSWAGQDDAGGSGLAEYDVYVSTDGGAAMAWMQGTTLTQAMFYGEPNHTYGFYGVARDNAGNVELPPGLPDAETQSPDTIGPTIVSWHSAAAHGTAGEVLLEIPDDGSFSEPRAGGVTRLVIDFSRPIDPGTFTEASVVIAGSGGDGLPVDLSGLGMGVSTAQSHTVGIIDFAPALPDAARYLVRIEGLTDAEGEALSGVPASLETADVVAAADSWQQDAATASSVPQQAPLPASYDALSLKALRAGEKGLPPDVLCDVLAERR